MPTNTLSSLPATPVPSWRAVATSADFLAAIQAPSAPAKPAAAMNGFAGPVTEVAALPYPYRLPVAKAALVMIDWQVGAVD